MSERLKPQLPASTAPKSEIQVSDSYTGVLKNLNKRRKAIGVVLLTGYLAGCHPAIGNRFSEDEPPVSVNLETLKSLTPVLTDKDIADAKSLLKDACPPGKKANLFYTNDGIPGAGGPNAKGVTIYCSQKEGQTGLAGQAYQAGQADLVRQANLEAERERRMLKMFEKGHTKVPPPPPPLIAAPPPPFYGVQNNVDIIHATSGVGEGTFQGFARNLAPALGGLFGMFGLIFRNPDEIHNSVRGGDTTVNTRVRTSTETTQGQSGPTIDNNPVNAPVNNPTISPTISPDISPTIDVPSPTQPMPPMPGMPPGAYD